MSSRRRIIITGKNNELPREVFSRPAANSTRVLPFSSSICAAGLSSGTKPDAAAGGTRLLAPRTSTAPHQPPRRGVVEVHFATGIGRMFVAGCLTVALLTLVLI